MDWGFIGDGGQALRQALMDLRLRDLPQQLREGSGFWTRALVLVRRVGGGDSWYLAERDARGVVRYVKDYSVHARPIAGVVSIHPFEYLDTAAFGVRYADESACRRALAAFYKRRMARKVACGVNEGQAYERLRVFTEERVRMCEECERQDLAWLDRERMMFEMRESGAERDAYVSPVKEIVSPEENYGEEKRLRTIDSKGEEPVRKGRRRKKSEDIPATKVSKSMDSGVTGKTRIRKVKDNQK